MVYKTFVELESAVMGKAHKCRVAVVEAADAHVLEAVRHAVDVGLVEPLLFGNPAAIEGKMRQVGLSPDACPVIAATDPLDAATRAGLAVKGGDSITVACDGAGEEAAAAALEKMFAEIK